MNVIDKDCMFFLITYRLSRRRRPGPNMFIIKVFVCTSNILRCSIVIVNDHNSTAFILNPEPVSLLMCLVS